MLKQFVHILGAAGMAGCMQEASHQLEVRVGCPLSCRYRPWSLRAPRQQHLCACAVSSGRWQWLTAGTRIHWHQGISAMAGACEGQPETTQSNNVISDSTSSTYSIETLGSCRCCSSHQAGKGHLVVLKNFQAESRTFGVHWQMLHG